MKHKKIMQISYRFALDPFQPIVQVSIFIWYVHYIVLHER